MLIAVIADTHDRYPPGLPDRLRRADEIWHLGDVCEPDVLEEFQALGRPMQIVLGNNEWHQLWPHELTLERERQQFFLTHIPPRKAPPGAKVILHGHTHVPRDETDPAGVRCAGELRLADRDRREADPLGVGTGIGGRASGLAARSTSPMARVSPMS
jgi:putative phosphoesterase